MSGEYGNGLLFAPALLPHRLRWARDEVNGPGRPALTRLVLCESTAVERRFLEPLHAVAHVPADCSHEIAAILIS